jgi:hypothetical protein
MKTYFKTQAPRLLVILRSMGSGSFTCASPRAIILVAPYLGLCWRQPSGTHDLTPKWLAATSVAPHTEELSGSVVDTLLQIAADDDLWRSIPTDVWLWLNERPPLPSVCAGRLLAGRREVVQRVQELNDIKILTSYLILVWSEWEYHDSVDFPPIDGFSEMRVSICKDFKGLGMGCHRAELIQRLDYILGELDRRSGGLDVNLEDNELWHSRFGHSSRKMKDLYGEFKRMLEVVDQEATETLNRMAHSFIFPSPLTFMDLHRIPLHLHVCPAAPVSMKLHIAFITINII